MWINVHPQVGSTDACHIPAHNAQIGANPPTGTSPGDRVIDGQAYAQVSCTVSGSGSFTVSGSISQGPTSFQIDGTVNGTSGTGTAGEYDPQSAQSLVSDPGDCTITVTAPQEIASGRIWASFECNSFSNPSVPKTTACASSGHFVFDNCSE